MYQCPGCGADMRFDIDKQELYCSHCDKTMKVEEYNKNYRKSTERETTVTKEDNKTVKVNVCTCSQCGAELLSDVNTVATFCSYCGNPQMLSSKIADVKRPDMVVPFKVNTEQAEHIYKKYVGSKFFAPREFRDKTVVEKIRGIYMPHTVINYDFNGEITSEGKRCYSRGNYDYTDYYDLNADVNCSFEMSGHDTSLAYDDLLSEAIAPYDLNDAKEFNEGYLTGFYADSSDVSGGSYLRMYDNEISNIIGKDIVKLDKDYRRYSVSNHEAGMGVVRKVTPKAKNAFFPVWFLSCKHGNDRISYAVINGQTGEVAAELPISYIKFIIVGLIVAAILFFLYITFVPFNITPIGMLIAALGLNIISISIASSTKKKVLKREKQINGEIETITEPITSKLDKPVNTGIGIALVIGFILIGIFPTVGIVLLFLAIAIAIIVGITKLIVKKVKSDLSHGTKYFIKSLIATLRNVASIGVAIATLLFATFHDEYYYYAEIFVIAMSLISFLEIIQSYNQLTTRKLPQFNKRGGE